MIIFRFPSEAQARAWYADPEYQVLSEHRRAERLRSAFLDLRSSGEAMRTRITELFDIQHPIIQGGMHFVGFAELAAAVSNAGGSGIVTGLTQKTPALLAEEIAKCRALTDKPFGVNLTFLPTVCSPDYPGCIRAILDGGVKAVKTAGNNRRKWLPMLQEAGVKVIHKCTSVCHSLEAQAIGCDAVSVDGFECGGRPGEDDIPDFILLPRAADALKIPFAASGGMADGCSLVAALALGAEGMDMGTRFIATQEAPVHRNMKDAIVAASELDAGLVHHRAATGAVCGGWLSRARLIHRRLRLRRHPLFLSRAGAMHGQLPRSRLPAGHGQRVSPGGAGQGQRLQAAEGGAALVRPQRRPRPSDATRIPRGLWFAPVLRQRRQPVRRAHVCRQPGRARLVSPRPRHLRQERTALGSDAPRPSAVGRNAGPAMKTGARFNMPMFNGTKSWCSPGGGAISCPCLRSRIGAATASPADRQVMDT
jgi:NAD(P)H-dependent flavin oxidoreductase YrpB (nitropropane dioxygenase family)